MQKSANIFLIKSLWIGIGEGGTSGKWHKFSEHSNGIRRQISMITYFTSTIDKETNKKHTEHI